MEEEKEALKRIESSASMLVFDPPSLAIHPRK